MLDPHSLLSRSACLFFRDGINLVADSNSRRGGCCRRSSMSVVAVGPTRLIFLIWIVSQYWTKLIIKHMSLLSVRKKEALPTQCPSVRPPVRWSWIKMLHSSFAGCVSSLNDATLIDGLSVRWSVRPSDSCASDWHSLFISFTAKHAVVEPYSLKKPFFWFSQDYRLFFWIPFYGFYLRGSAKISDSRFLLFLHTLAEFSDCCLLVVLYILSLHLQLTNSSLTLVH